MKIDPDVSQCPATHSDSVPGHPAWTVRCDKHALHRGRHRAKSPTFRFGELLPEADWEVILWNDAAAPPPPAHIGGVLHTGLAVLPPGYEAPDFDPSTD